MSKENTKEELIKGIGLRIHFYEDSLAQYRFALSPSTQYILEQTIKDLKELKRLKEITSNATDPSTR